MTKTIIVSNGSKFAGEEPDSIDTLKGVLKNHRLEWSRFNNKFIHKTKNKDEWQILGNFINISHVFNIETNDRVLVGELRRLINANKKIAIA